MTGVRWDIRDIMSQHNAYVDMLVRVKTYLPCNLYSRDTICCFTFWRPLFKIDQKKKNRKKSMKIKLTWLAIMVPCPLPV